MNERKLYIADENKDFINFLEDIPLDGFVVIDVGHFELKIDLGQEESELQDDNSFKSSIIAQEKIVSSTQIKTVQEGILIAKKMLDRGIASVVNICFSDTSKNINPYVRKRLISYFSNGVDKNNFSFLPIEYQKLFIEAEFPLNSINITSQAANSNKATNLIKKIKKSIKNVGQEKSFNNTGVLGLGIEDTDLFAISTPEFFYGNDSIKTNSHYSYDDGFIGLFGGKGTLCPATCMGMLQSLLQKFPKEKLFLINLYDENDDPSISNKLHGGVFSFRGLSQKGLGLNIANIISRKDIKKTDFIFPMVEAGIAVENSYIHKTTNTAIFGLDTTVNESRVVYNDFVSDVLESLDSFGIDLYQNVRTGNKIINDGVSVCSVSGSCIL